MYRGKESEGGRNEASKAGGQHEQTDGPWREYNNQSSLKSKKKAGTGLGRKPHMPHSGAWIMRRPG